MVPISKKKNKIIKWKFYEFHRLNVNARDQIKFNTLPLTTYAMPKVGMWWSFAILRTISQYEYHATQMICLIFCLWNVYSIIKSAKVTNFSFFYFKRILQAHLLYYLLCIIYIYYLHILFIQIVDENLNRRPRA